MPRRSRPAGPPVDLAVTLAGIRLANPIVAASGTYGHGVEVARLCPPDRLGAVTVKSLAAYEWPGNPPPRLAPAAGGGMLNSVGLQGPGVEHWVEHELPELAALGARVVASVWGRTVDDFAVAAKMLAPAVADLIALELNVSCPNLEDRSRTFAHSSSSTAAVVRGVAAADLGLPLFAKLSPNTFEVVDIAGAAIEAGAHGLTLVNTLLGLGVDASTRRPQLGAIGGGLSGPPLKPVALRVVHDVARAFPGAPIIGTGGVSTGEDAVELLLAVRDRTFILDGFSKTFCMTGWRLGYLISPKNFVPKFDYLLTHMVGCTATFTQYAGIAALQSDPTALSKMLKEFAKRRDFIVQRLNSISGVTCKTPGGAFYVFPNIKSFGLTSDKMADYILNKAGVALLSGTSFGNKGEGYLRISYATSMDKLVEGCDKIEKALAKL